MPLFLVETVSTCRHRYMIDAPDEATAESAVKNQDSGNPEDRLYEFSQRFTDEQLLDVNEITKEHFKRLQSALEVEGTKESGSPWIGERVINRVGENDESLQDSSQV